MTREVRTDDDGYAELKLVRGSLVEVMFENTSIRRRLRVPTAGAEFDFLDFTLADDEFGIAVPVLKIAAPHSP